MSLDADPLGAGPRQIVHARGFAARRQARKGGDAIGRLYAVESTPTLTGANADHRITLPLAQIMAVTVAIARALGAAMPEATLAKEAAAFQTNSRETCRRIRAARSLSPARLLPPMSTRFATGSTLSSRPRSTISKPMTKRRRRR